MEQPLEFENLLDGNGNPAGGFARAVGLEIQWQDGPLGRDKDRQEPNGAFVETVIQAAIQRLHWYQSGKFACAENSAAVGKLQSALAYLKQRTASREARGVEGTHEP